jgi:hypothetical protein
MPVVFMGYAGGDGAFLGRPSVHCYERHSIKCFTATEAQLVHAELLRCKLFYNAQIDSSKLQFLARGNGRQ